MPKEISIAEIAEVEGFDPTYVARILREKGAPDPVRKIGLNKMYGLNEALSFMAARRARIASRGK